MFSEAQHVNSRWELGQWLCPLTSIPLRYGALAALAGSPSLAYGATDPTDGSFKSIRVWVMTLVYLAKVVLFVSSFICCFIFQFFLLTVSCALQGRWNLHSISCPFAQSYISWPLKCGPSSLSIHTQCSASLISWLTQWPGKSWVKPDAVSIENQACLKSSLFKAIFFAKGLYEIFNTIFDFTHFLSNTILQIHTIT